MRNVPGHRVTLRDKRILVAEDEAIVAMLIEDELVDAGAQVVGPATSVEEALRLIEEPASAGGLSAAVLDFDLEGEQVLPVADRLAALGVPFLFATGAARVATWAGMPRRFCTNRSIPSISSWPSRPLPPSAGDAARLQRIGVQK